MTELKTLPPRLSLPQACTLYVEILPGLVNGADPRLAEFADDIARVAGDGTLIGRYLAWADGSLGFVVFDPRSLWSPMVAPLMAYERARAAHERHALQSTQVPQAGAH